MRSGSCCVLEVPPPVCHTLQEEQVEVQNPNVQDPVNNPPETADNDNRVARLRHKIVNRAVNLHQPLENRARAANKAQSVPLQVIPAGCDALHPQLLSHQDHGSGVYTGIFDSH